MRKHYRVKWTGSQGEPRYGIAEDSVQAERAIKKGFLIIEDAVLPKRECVPEKAVTDIKFPPDERTDEFDEYIDKEFEKARKTSNALKKPGVGSMFKIGVADGYAHYVVTAVKDTRCQVQWRGFSPDRYIDHHFEYRGMFPWKAVKRYVQFEIDDYKLFGGTLFEPLSAIGAKGTKPSTTPAEAGGLSLEHQATLGWLTGSRPSPGYARPR